MSLVSLKMNQKVTEVSIVIFRNVFKVISEFWKAKKNIFISAFVGGLIRI